MTNLHGEKKATKTLKIALMTKPSVATLTHSISMTSGAAGIPIRFTGVIHSTTIDMYDPDDDHSSDYAEERHDAICEARDIDQGIKPLIEDDEDEE